MNLSAIDSVNSRYFFVGFADQDSFLYALELDTGKIIFEYKLENRLVVFNYNERKDEIYAISDVNGVNNFVKYDIYNNEMVIIKKMKNLSGVVMLTPKINYEDNTFLFKGYVDDKSLFLAIDMVSGDMKQLEYHEVNVGDYKVFRQDKESNIFFTIGVQTCAAIVGYSENYQVGFIAHFPPSYKHTKETIAKIEEEIKEIDIDGFKNMDLFIIGGVRDLNDSYQNVANIYNEIINKYKIDYQGNKIYHLGRPYNIIVNRGVDIW